MKQCDAELAKGWVQFVPIHAVPTAELFATSVPNINMHISNILKDKELDSNSVIKNYLITADDGKNYNVTFYSLEMIISVCLQLFKERQRYKF